MGENLILLCSFVILTAQTWFRHKLWALKLTTETRIMLIPQFVWEHLKPLVPSIDIWTAVREVDGAHKITELTWCSVITADFDNSNSK